jgi:hypothetical protein
MSLRLRAASDGYNNKTTPVWFLREQKHTSDGLWPRKPSNRASKVKYFCKLDNSTTLCELRTIQRKDSWFNSKFIWRTFCSSMIRKSRRVECHAIRPAASSVLHQSSVDAGLRHASMHSGVSPSFITIFLIASNRYFETNTSNRSIHFCRWLYGLLAPFARLETRNLYLLYPSNTACSEMTGARVNLQALHMRHGPNTSSLILAGNNW